MGVADNKSYKDQYHFREDKLAISPGDYPSISKEPKINSTIKENPYRSNVEIEGGEIVLQPDLTALFKAKGPKHSRGGMDVLLKPESFIYSDFKGLEFTENERELFELKEGGKSNTPAEILKKNVNPKHYNTLVNILDDPYKDDLSKKTATLMLEKYIQTLGNIAYVQEEKKGFPQGLPAFSMGTAPVYNPSLKDSIEQNKQFMKAGGTTGNPYAQMGMINARNITPSGGTDRRPKNPNAWYDQRTGKWHTYNPTDFDELFKSFETNAVAPPPQNQQTQTTPPWGLWKGDILPIFQNRFGVSNAADKFEDLRNWDDVTKELGYTGPKDNKAFQEWLYSSSPENKAIIDKWHTKYEDPSIAVSQDKRNRFDRKIGIRWANAIREIRQGKSPRIDLVHQPSFSEPPREGEPAKPLIATQTPGPEVSNIDATPQGSKQADWRFTPWQRLSHLWNFGQYANVKRYMPYRSRYNATYVDPALVNPEQAVGDIRATGAQQLSSISTLNPILRNAQASSIAGQMLNSIPGVRSQYDNQNAQILNQTRQYNTQVKNNESLVNMANDQTYYTQAIEARKNFDNMRTYTANQYMNNIMRDVETNQKLAYNLLTQNNPAYDFDWRTGNFTRTNKSILDVSSNAVNDRYQNLLGMIENISDPTEKAKAALKLEGLRVFGSASSESPKFYKKGGKTKNPYK